MGRWILITIQNQTITNAGVLRQAQDDTPAPLFLYLYSNRGALVPSAFVLCYFETELV